MLLNTQPKLVHNLHLLTTHLSELKQADSQVDIEPVLLVFF